MRLWSESRHWVNSIEPLNWNVLLLHFRQTIIRDTKQLILWMRLCDDYVDDGTIHMNHTMCELQYNFQFYRLICFISCILTRPFFMENFSSFKNLEEKCLFNLILKRYKMIPKLTNHMHKLVQINFDDFYSFFKCFLNSNCMIKKQANWLEVCAAWNSLKIR